MKTIQTLALFVLPALGSMHAADLPIPWTNNASFWGKSALPAKTDVPFPGVTNSPLTSTAGVGWYNVTGSPAHINYTAFDDTNAYDFNLAGDRDNGLPVIAVDAGKVIAYSSFASVPNTTSKPEANPFGAVLIDHGYWCTGYMHMKDIKVSVGNTVTRGTVIGYVSKKIQKGLDAVPNHLHYAVYEKVWNATTKKYRLVSKTQNFVDDPVVFTGSPSYSLKVGGTLLIPNAPEDFSTIPISNATWFNNTYWTSNKAAVAKVDAYGKVTAVAVGTATISTPFCGKTYNFTFTVTSN